jgi:hypothetical protein
MGDTAKPDHSVKRSFVRSNIGDICWLLMERYWRYTGWSQAQDGTTTDMTLLERYKRGCTFRKTAFFQRGI